MNGLTESRLASYASSCALIYALIIILQVRYHILIGPKDCIDFTWIWLSSKVTISGQLAQAYDYSVFSSARETIVGPPNCVLQHLDYPPTLLLFTYPLGLMPYPLAFTVWMVATLLIYLGAIHTIIPRWAAVIAGLTPYPVFINILLGHNGFLTAGLLGLALAFMECQPWLTGVLFGLLSFKPQFGILFPVVLLASRNWRIFFSATVTSVILALIAAVAFGYQVWAVFIAALAERAESLSQDPTLNSPLISFLGMLQFAGTSAKISWSVQLIVTVMTALVVGSLWARPVSYPLKAAALAIGSILAAPHAVQYDLCILSIAAAFLVRDGLVRGFLRGERVVMLICWTGIFLKGLYPAIVCVVLLTLVIRRTNLNQREFDAAGPRALASAKA